MSLNGITSPLLASLPPVRPNGAAPGVRPNTDNTPAPLDRATNGASAPALRQQPSVASNGGSTVPAEAPAGTDPELWSVLTTEERTFFAKTAALGPLTYGKIKNATLPAPPAMRGGRLDVRA